MIVNCLLLCLLAISPAIGSPNPVRLLELEVKKSIDHLQAIKAPVETPILEHVTQQVHGQKDESRDQPQAEVKRSFQYLQPKTEREQSKAGQAEPSKYQVLRPLEQKREELPAQKEEQKREELPVQKEEQKREELPVQKEEQKREELPVQKEEQKREELPLQKEEQKREELPIQKEEQKRDDIPLKNEEQKRVENPQQKDEQRRDELPAQKEEQKRDETPLEKEPQNRDFPLKVEERRLDQIQYHSEIRLPEQRSEKPVEAKSVSQSGKQQEGEPIRHEDDHHKENCNTSPLPFDCDKRPDPLANGDRKATREEAKVQDLKQELSQDFRSDVTSVHQAQGQIKKDQHDSMAGKTREEALRAPTPASKGGQPTHALTIQGPALHSAEESKRGKEQLQLRAPTKNQKSIQQDEVLINQENIRNAELRAPLRFGDLRQPQKAPLGFESSTAHNRAYQPRPIYLVPARYPTIPGVMIRSYVAPVRGGPVVSRAHLQRARYPPSPVQGYHRNYRTGFDQPVYGRPRVSFYSPITRQLDQTMSGF